MFESLKIFIAAAERGSINGAAETCFITPPAALKRINSLEAEVGVRLFERSGRGVKLTRAGESYYRDALKIVAEGEDATARARRVAGGSVVIRAGTSILNPCKPLVDLWNNFAAEFPQYRIEIVPFCDSVAELSEIYAHLGRRFGVMFGVYDSAAAIKPFKMLELGRTRFCVAAPADHRLAAKSSVNLDDLSGERIIIVRLGMSPAVDKIRGALLQRPKLFSRIRRNITISACSTAACRRACCCSLSNTGMTCIPQSLPFRSKAAARRRTDCCTRSRRGQRWRGLPG